MPQLLSADSSWTETIVIEPSTPFHRAGSLALRVNLPDASQKHEFGACTMTVRAENWRMRDVTLVPPWGLLFKGEQEVAAARYAVFPQEAASIRALMQGPRRSLSDERCYFSAFNRYCVNYFHMITQILPAIAGYEHCPGFQDGVLLVGAPAPVLLRMLHLTGIRMPEMIEIRPTTPIDIANLTISSYLSEDNLLSPFSLSIFDKLVRNTISPNANASNTKQVIYVWRTDSKFRPMLNEDELVERLIRNFNVKPVILTSYTLDQQIALFHNAKLVIGPHGAGLANIVFCSPGAVLYELLPDHYLNPCVNQLAQLRGLHYWCDAHKADQGDGLFRHHVPWTVDIDAVELRLTEIIATHDLASSINP